MIGELYSCDLYRGVNIFIIWEDEYFYGEVIDMNSSVNVTLVEGIKGFTGEGCLCNCEEWVDKWCDLD